MICHGIVWSLQGRLNKPPNKHLVSWWPRVILRTYLWSCCGSCLCIFLPISSGDENSSPFFCSKQHSFITQHIQLSAISLGTCLYYLYDTQHGLINWALRLFVLDILQLVHLVAFSWPLHTGRGSLVGIHSFFLTKSQQLASLG